ncbi:maestro heat-like repeat family member 5 [Liasis olivaceus]
MPHRKISQPLALDKILLYKYYGMKLRNSRSKDIVNEYLQMLLGLPFQEETDREGISEAIGVAAFCHLSEILTALRDFGHVMQARKSSLFEAMPEESRNLSERYIRTTLLLCYGQAAMGARPEDMLLLVEHIVSEILFHFSTTNKDKAMKKAFLRAVIMISKALLHSKRQDVYIPHKAELVIAIIEVIGGEPMGTFSVTNLHQAITTVSCMTKLKPPLDPNVRSELVNKSIQKVFSLPALKMTKVKANSPAQPVQTQDFYQQTITACNSMLASLLSEAPSLESLQDILMHTNIWIDSPTNYERERAIKSTRHLLKFVSEHFDFDTTGEFPMLGQLVALLALHIADSVREIGQASAEATYHLHYIIMNKMAGSRVLRLRVAMEMARAGTGQGQGQGQAALRASRGQPRGDVPLPGSRGRPQPLQPLPGRRLRLLGLPASNFPGSPAFRGFPGGLPSARPGSPFGGSIQSDLRLLICDGHEPDRTGGSPASAFSSRQFKLSIRAWGLPSLSAPIMSIGLPSPGAPCLCWPASPIIRPRGSERPGLGLGGSRPGPPSAVGPLCRGSRSAQPKAGSCLSFPKRTSRLAMFKQANTYLCHPDSKERTIGMAFFTELIPDAGVAEGVCGSG